MIEIVDQSLIYCVPRKDVSHAELSSSFTSVLALEVAIRSSDNAPCNGCTDQSLIQTTNTIIGLKKKESFEGSNLCTYFVYNVCDSVFVRSLIFLLLFQKLMDEISVMKEKVKVSGEKALYDALLLLTAKVRRNET